MLNLVDVEKIAELARLAFSPEEMEKFRKELSNILGYVEKIQPLDTTGIEPTAHAVFKPTPLREDEPGAAFTVDEALANAPDRDGPFFVVPRIVG